MDVLWMGWPGAEIKPQNQNAVVAKCKEVGSIPVFLTNDQIELFYNGFCNNILWPLFHYVPPPLNFAELDAQQREYAAYVEANEIFVDQIVAYCDSQSEDDQPYVWVHDYHLMLVPRLLRQQRPDLKIGWFLHTPWPDAEVFRLLPARSEILKGLLHADLLAFHVYDYQRHFSLSCQNILGLAVNGGSIDAAPIGGRIVLCTSIPIGIEPRTFIQKIPTKGVGEYISKMRVDFGVGRKVVLGVDRLDYMKGIPHKLNAFDKMMEMYPEMLGNVVLVQVAVPSRSTVEEYRRLKSHVHELVGKINGKRGGIGFIPVHYLDRSVTPDELTALYRIADVCFITSLRDGMNLVAFEYVATQKGRYGVLCLSEFTGASQSLAAGSISFNPWSVEGAAQALYQALTLPIKQRFHKHDYLFRHVQTHTAQRWAETFLDALFSASEENLRANTAPLLDFELFCTRFKCAAKRLLFVVLPETVSGRHVTLTKPSHEAHRSDYAHKGEHLNGEAPRTYDTMSGPKAALAALRALTTDANTHVVLFSAESRDVVNEVVGDLCCLIIAEGGAVYRPPGEQVWLRPRAMEEYMESATGEALGEVMRQSIHILEANTRKIPGSKLQSNASSVRWTWDISVSGLSRKVAAELLSGPLLAMMTPSFQISFSPTSLEATPRALTKVTLLRQILTETDFAKDFTFVAAIANFDPVDENVYDLLATFMCKPAAIESPELAVVDPDATVSEITSALTSRQGSLEELLEDGRSRFTLPDFFAITSSTTTQRANYRLHADETCKALLEGLCRATTQPNHASTIDTATLGASTESVEATASQASGGPNKG